MYKFELKSPSDQEIISVKNMKIGQIGVVQGPMYGGEIIIRTYDRLVSLKDVAQTWNNIEESTLKVKLLPRDSKITLIVGD